MATPLTLDITNDGGKAVVRVVGEIDLASAPRLRDGLLAAGHEGAPVEVDFTQVTFMDSSGVGALLDAQSACQADNVTIVVTAVSPAVDKVLRLAGIAKTFGLPA